MTNRMRSGVVLTALLVALGGCVSVLPEPEAPEALYRIEPMREKRELAANMVVREPHAPAILAGQAMASVDQDGAVRLMPSVEWAGRSTRQFQLALVESFSTSGAGAALLPETAILADYELSTRLEVFELRQGFASCEITMMLLSDGGKSLAAQHSAAVIEPSDSDRTVDRAIALKRAGDKCVDQVAKFAEESIAAAVRDNASR